MLKRSSSTTTRKELKSIRSNSLRKINFSVPAISESRVEQEIIKQTKSITSLDSTTSRYARTTFILEVAENRRSYSECDTSENYSSTNIEEATSGFCSAETAESATRIFAKLSLKKKQRIATKSQSDSRIGKRKRCCCCKLPLCPIDNYADEDKENEFCRTLFVEERMMAPTSLSSTTFKIESSEEELASNRSIEVKVNKFGEYLMTKPCLGSNSHPHRKPCRESDSEDESMDPMTLVKIAVLEELCERLLEKMCSSAPIHKGTPKKAISAMSLSCKGKALKYPKSKTDFCFKHKAPLKGALVPHFCLNRRFDDTVDLYQYYNCQWKRFHNRILTDDIDPRYALSWQIREKFLNLKYRPNQNRQVAP